MSAVLSSTAALPREITPESVEQAHRFATLWQKAGRYGAAQIGLRAARAKDPVLMRVLDQSAEVLQRMQESQVGQTRRQGQTEGEKVDLTEFSLWREAYRMADEGHATTMGHFQWIYAGAAWLAGLVVA